MNEKNNLIKVIHTAKRALALSDENYRSILECTTNKDSCKNMNVQELKNVLANLRNLGFNNNQSNTKKHNTKMYFTNNQYRLCYAIWKNLYNLGEVKNSSADALNKFIERMCPDFEKEKSLRFIPPYKMAKVIEELKEFEKRVQKKIIYKNMNKANLLDFASGEVI